MDTKKDLEYAEIMELAAIQPDSTKESATAETQFGTYVNVADIMKPRAEPSRDSTLSRDSATSTFRRYSGVDETGSSYYEDMIISSVPIRERIASTDQILTSRPDLTNGNVEHVIEEDVLSLRTRLRIKKQRFKFKEYFIYAMVAIFEEVESILCLDVIFLIFSVLLVTLGVVRVGGCRMSPKIPVMMVVCGLLDGLANFFSMLATAACTARRADCRHLLRDIARIDRILLFFMHMYSLILVYLILPPEEKDHDSPNYCDASTFWAAFCYFHVTFFSTVFLWIGMLVGASSYFI